ncbi:hypothetical protein Plhal703r1_c53g0159261 [Plasmopara halstedii]
MASYRPLLLLLTATNVLSALAHSVAAANLPPSDSSPSLRHQTNAMCLKFASICDFVAQNCNTQVKARPWLATLPIADDSSKCAESFSLFHQHNKTLVNCMREFPPESKEMTQALVFLKFYSAWQQQNTCKLFHATEARSAAECSFNALRPWTQTTLSMYCHDVFTMYKNSRHKLDVLCERTSNSDTFWEGYVDFIGSKTCKHYYDIIREAREQGCGNTNMALHGTRCQQMFEWYSNHKDVVETDCFEVRASKPFYHGFYLWKKQQH